MGVPKFFRSISERYPCISELVKEFQIPDFDNLYLDMNGIIHTCSHPNDLDPHFSITEEKIFSSIFHYIEVLFNMIKPKKLFFMAVDGVAPRAKMNQQRARRYRTAKEAEIKYKEALKTGEKPVPKERFDSNCITPGTVFMDKLHSQLQYFVTSKISTDPLWQGCKIILSGHQTPGEGEHKIMDYIRYLKTLPDYDDNTRHCLYGLDADLIMLGMCTHEPHFSLLREKVQFSKQQSKQVTSPDEMEFYLFHLSLLREYLDLEFQELKETISFQYNLENIIDDWILMGFLVGNDFIPNLPDLHINKGAFPIMFKAYKEVLPTLDGYLNENGYLNLPRFQKFMEKMADHDLKSFEDIHANLAYLEEKTGKSFLSDKLRGSLVNGEAGRNLELEELIRATKIEMSDEESLDEDFDENDENYTFLLEFNQHKKNYYTHKLDFSKVTPEVLASQAEGYVRAIQWTLHYYYQGCQSWSWYYPHHYAPYISDIKDFKDFKLDFEMGRPFLPFEQLLAVLPPASKNLLPEPFQDLMTSPNSPIKDFYPEDFETDLNGKQQDWEAIVLIPFIDEVMAKRNKERLLKAMEPCNDKLSAEERKRNRHGPMHVFSYTNENLGAFKSVQYFPTTPVNHALMKDLYREEIAVEKSNLKYGLRPGVLLDVMYPGFPSLKHIPHSGHLKESKVKVFDHPSKGDSMILTLKEREFPSLNVLAKNLLGKIMYINWPHLVESRAIAVTNKEMKYFLTEEANINCEIFDKQMQLQWEKESEALETHYSEKLGVEIGPVEVIVHVLTLSGWKYIFGPVGKILTEKIWCTTPTNCALQVIVQDVQTSNQFNRRYKDFPDAFPVNSVVFMLGQPHFGSMGRVLESTDCFKNGRLKVELEVHKDLVVSESLMKCEPKTPYFPCKVVALKVGISPHLLSRITGSIFVSMTKGGLNNSGSKVNIGLNLKFSKKNEEIPGYSKRDNENWLYSTKAIALVAAYAKNFSSVVEFLSSHQGKNVFFVEEIFPGPEGVTKMKDMVAWIKAQEYNQVRRLKCGTSILDSNIVSELEQVIDSTSKKHFTRHMQIKPHLLYKSDLVFGNIPPIKSAKHSLLDRVVSIRSSHTVPTGLRGFIIGIHPAPLEADFMYDILFDEPFLGGMKLNSSSERGFRMSRASFLNISDGNRHYHRSTCGLAPANACLRPYYDEPKTSAFAQWSNQPCVKDNDEFKKMWSNLQTAKPQEDALKKLLKIDKKNKEKDNFEDPVKLFFEKVSKVSNEGVQIVENNTALLTNNFQPGNQYYLQLFSKYQKRGLGQPRFKYLYTGGKVMAQVFFSDGKVYSGLPCNDKESACESASFQALVGLGEISLTNEMLAQKEKERILESQIKLSNALMKPKDANQNQPPQTTYRLNNRRPPLLPDPPSQWMGHNKSLPSQKISPQFYFPKDNYSKSSKKNVPEQGSSNISNKKLNASALEFVPLQAITGKRNFGNVVTIPNAKQVTESSKKTEVVATFINDPGTSTPTVKAKRRPKIAAKLNLDPNLY